MKYVLVTGGTGFLGSNVALALLKEGYVVRILRRRTSDLRAIGNADVQHAIGDVRDLESLRCALKGCDTVFHTAALISYWRKERAEMYRTNIDGTRNVVQACLDTGVEKLVHTSSVAAIGFAEDGSPATESTQFNWERYDVGYRISKYRAEQEILRGVKLGLPAVMVNPSAIIGPGDIHFHGGQLLRDVHKKRIFYYIRGGMNVVYVDDVVRGHLQAAKHGRIGERYILSGENLSHREVLTITAEVVGGIKPFFLLPSPLVRLIGTTVEAVSTPWNIKPWVTRELLAGTGLSSFYSCEKAMRELGYSITPFRKAVTLTFHWYKEQGML